MGVTITVPSADFSGSPVGYVPVVPDGLAYLNFFGGSAERTARNLAPGGAPGEIVGTPVYTTTSVRLTPKSHYIRTAVPQTASMTVLLVVKPLSIAQNAMAFGNFGSPRTAAAGNSNGVFILLPANAGSTELANVRFTAAQPSGAASQNINADLPQSLRVGSLQTVVGRLDDSTKQRRIMVPATGLQTSVVGTLPTDIGVGPLLIGSYYDATSAHIAPLEIAAAAIYTRALSDVEIARLYASVAAYFDRRGISV